VPKRDSLVFQLSWLREFANNIRKVAKSQDVMAKFDRDTFNKLREYQQEGSNAHAS
jgi:hypothetical protein